MAKKRDVLTMSLFPPEPVEEPKIQTLPLELQRQCKHYTEVKGEMEWPGYPPGDPRMVWICVNCGHYRGRV